MVPSHARHRRVRTVISFISIYVAHPLFNIVINVISFLFWFNIVQCTVYTTTQLSLAITIHCPEVLSNNRVFVFVVCTLFYRRSVRNTLIYGIVVAPCTCAVASNCPAGGVVRVCNDSEWCSCVLHFFVMILCK